MSEPTIKGLHYDPTTELRQSVTVSPEILLKKVGSICEEPKTRFERKPHTNQRSNEFAPNSRTYIMPPVDILEAQTLLNEDLAAVTECAVLLLEAIDKVPDYEWERIMTQSGYSSAIDLLIKYSEDLFVKLRAKFGWPKFNPRMTTEITFENLNSGWQFRLIQPQSNVCARPTAVEAIFGTPPETKIYADKYPHVLQPSIKVEEGGKILVSAWEWQRETDEYSRGLYVSPPEEVYFDIYAQSPFIPIEDMDNITPQIANLPGETLVRKKYNELVTAVFTATNNTAFPVELRKSAANRLKEIVRAGESLPFAERIPQLEEILDGMDAGKTDPGAT